MELLILIKTELMLHKRWKGKMKIYVALWIMNYVNKNI